MSNTTAAPEEASPDTAFHAGPARAHPGIQTTRNGGGPELPPGPGWAEEVRRLAAERDAVILAHNYQRPEIQDVADHVGDSLALSRLAADSPAREIVFAGVYFMAETAKILSPDKTVLIPDQRAGCSLADSITATQLREWKAEHPARWSGMSTVLSGLRIFAVSAMKWTPQNTMVSSGASAATRDSASESPT